MIQWISENHKVLSVLVNFGMLIIWLLYAQLLLRSFRNSRKTKVIIAMINNMESAKSRCMITNMSSSHVYVQDIIVKLHTSEGVRRSTVTDYAGISANNEGMRFETCQGPLAAGEFIDLGEFEKFIDWASRNQPYDSTDGKAESETLESLELSILFSHRSESHVVGAKRVFNLEENDQGNNVIIPEYTETKQIRNFLATRELKKEMRQLVKDRKRYSA